MEVTAHETALGRVNINIPGDSPVFGYPAIGMNDGLFLPLQVNSLGQVIASGGGGGGGDPATVSLTDLGNVVINLPTESPAFGFPLIGMYGDTFIPIQTDVNGKLIISGGGGGGTLAPSDGGTGTTTVFTQGSVVFAGGSGIYTQDNAHFFWDDTNNRLGIGTNTPLSTLHVEADVVGSGQSTIPFSVLYPNGYLLYTSYSNISGTDYSRVWFGDVDARVNNTAFFLDDNASSIIVQGRMSVSLGDITRVQNGTYFEVNDFALYAKYVGTATQFLLDDNAKTMTYTGAGIEVGIGTSFPDTLLHIALGQINTQTFLFKMFANGIDGSSYYGFGTNQIGFGPGFDVDTNTPIPASSMVFSNVYNNSSISSSNPTYIFLGTSSAYNAYIVNGSIGLGASQPDTPLHIALGNIDAQTFLFKMVAHGIDDSAEHGLGTNQIGFGPGFDGDTIGAIPASSMIFSNTYVNSQLDPSAPTYIFLGTTPVTNDVTIVNGSIGVGTNVPSYQIDIKSPAALNTSTLLFRAADSGGSGVFGIDILNSSGINYPDIAMGDLASGGNTTIITLIDFNKEITLGCLGNVFVGDINGIQNGTVLVFNDSTKTFTYTGSGIAVGIGTLTPSELLDVASGNISISTAGKGLKIKEGSDARMGIATMVGGNVVVANTSVTANSRIFLTEQNNSGAIGSISVSARTAGTSFTISSTNALDTSDVAWLMIEPA